jgi:hypothetical protein
MVLSGEMGCEIIMSWARLGVIYCAAKEVDAFFDGVSKFLLKTIQINMVGLFGQMRCGA